MKREEFQIAKARKDNWKPSPVKGYVFKHLAVDGRPGLWTITHLRTGFRVTGSRGSLADVKRLASALDERIDWNFGKFGEPGLSREEQTELHEKVIAVRQEVESD